jgi:hypothetical protein|tara:strand:+ start:1237 stop:1539 length:303 start_codon:yes stop_codon:yes gene_type:complete
MKILATGSLNVADIPKHKLIKGAKGLYLNYKILVDTDADQFQNNGSITVNPSKEERLSKEPVIYLGNHRIVWMEEGDSGLSERPTPTPKVESKKEDDLPF